MRALWISFAALSLLAGCNTGEVGTACSGSATDEGVCVEGAVCAPEQDSSEPPPDPPNAVPSYCRTLCDGEADCTEPGFECRGVVGSMARACQPSDDPATSDAGT